MSRLLQWSRRKRGETPESPTDDAPQADLAAPERTPTPVEPQGRDNDTMPPPGSLDHTLPDPDTLPAGSDIQAFLASGVSTGLRKRALRRLFAAERYGVRDGLDDYDDDYRQHLKPLASEMAQRLRRWNQSLDDGGDEAEEDATARQPRAEKQESRIASSSDSVDASSPTTPDEAPEPSRGRTGTNPDFGQHS